ncbi:hypothetical protein PV08_02255 [Exophiala spinifera]|uniref:Transcription factor domain-containing protein n=1 Tax=Exophiala spinifera TaxID=91928 RepID=A0A0D2BTD3_9EURO|nr:uncharacterized protein PV08_02255 [Exophiala spinifera]KIW21675.1 hypothetical protein PV08_02255 [Exophiala spinifera]
MDIGQDTTASAASNTFQELNITFAAPVESHPLSISSIVFSPTKGSSISLNTPAPAIHTPLEGVPANAYDHESSSHLLPSRSTNSPVAIRHWSGELLKTALAVPPSDGSLEITLNHSQPTGSSVTGILTPAEEIPFLQVYLQQVGQWMENSDPSRHFTVKYVHQLLETPICRASILAVTARYKYAIDSSCSSRLALELYQNAVQKLISSPIEYADCLTLASCVLLAVYEMMASKHSDWLRHLEGCAAILTSKGWNGSSGGLVSSCFWSYAKVDIWAAFCNETSTLTSPSVWFNDTTQLLLGEDVEYQDHATILVWIFARIVNFLSYVSELSMDTAKTATVDQWKEHADSRRENHSASALVNDSTRDGLEMRLAVAVSAETVADGSVDCRC